MKFPGITLDEIRGIRAKKNSSFFHTLIQYSYLTHQYDDNSYLNTIRWNKQNRKDIIYTVVSDDIVKDKDIFISHNVIECYSSYSDKLNMIDYLSQIFL